MIPTSVILQVICPDRPGLVSELAGWVAINKGNIYHADHHTDHGAGLFISRIEWGLEGFRLSRDLIRQEVRDLALSLKGTAKVYFSDDCPRTAIFVSKQNHCLLDLLWRVKSKELLMEVPLIIANHNDLENLCLDSGVDFRCIPTNYATKIETEKKIIEILNEYRIDLVVLAKYMQILSEDFIKRYPMTINIHHSFLPAFKGSKPYHQAWNRGVKIIGATAHYITEALDDGPIIDQEIAHVSHRDEVDDLIRKGRDTERIALATALRLHLRRQVIIYSGRTAIFA